MKDLLPFVTNEIGFSLAASIGDEYDIDTWREQYRAIRKTNPAVAEFIKVWTKLGKDKLHCFIMGICVYKLLESQAEADRMSEEINI